MAKRGAENRIAENMGEGEMGHRIGMRGRTAFVLARVIGGSCCEHDPRVIARQLASRSMCSRSRDGAIKMIRSAVIFDTDKQVLARRFAFYRSRDFLYGNASVSILDYRDVIGMTLVHLDNWALTESIGY